MLNVEVIFACPERVIRTQIVVSDQATVGGVLALLRQHADFSSLLNNEYTVGVFGRICQADEVVRNNDRIELYRPLEVDAKTARRNRAEQQAANRN